MRSLVYDVVDVEEEGMMLRETSYLFEGENPLFTSLSSTTFSESTSFFNASSDLRTKSICYQSERRKEKECEGWTVVDE